MMANVYLMWFLVSKYLYNTRINKVETINLQLLKSFSTFSIKFVFSYLFNMNTSVIIHWNMNT